MIEITEAPVARTESPYISAYEAFVIEDKQSKRIIRYYKKVRSDEYYDWYVTIEPYGRIGLVRFADKTLKSEVFGLGEKYRTREVKTLNVNVTCSLVEPDTSRGERILKSEFGILGDGRKAHGYSSRRGFPVIPRSKIQRLK